jgi:hypothetical protein
MDAHRDNQGRSTRNRHFARCCCGFDRKRGRCAWWIFAGVALLASRSASLVGGQELSVALAPGAFDPFAAPSPVRSGPAALPAANASSGWPSRLGPASSDSGPEAPGGQPGSFSPWPSAEAVSGAESWTWQKLPDGVIYPSYLAGPKEPRFAAVFNHDAHSGWALDLEAGGRVGLLRYGTDGGPRPDGWELDLEGAAFPRLDLDHDEDLIAADFRVGVPLTFGAGPFQFKLAAYHLSSHLGDEYLVRFPATQRINYSRHALVLGGSYYVTDDLRLYAEAEWAFYADGGSRPWKFQFGLDYSPLRAGSEAQGSPFLALNGQSCQELDYGGCFVLQAGWQWRGSSNHLLRIGAQYFKGKSDQYEFYTRNEEKIGAGLWYDF